MLKKYLIPHEENEYKPHLLREFSVVFLSLLIIFLIPFFAFIYPAVITSDFLLSAIFPSALISFANEARFSNGARELKVNSALEEAAKLKAEDMAKKNYFAHVSPEGVKPWYWLGKAGYNFSAAGENLAIDFSDSKDVADAWLNSPGHRANILNKKFTEIGVATAKGIFNGRETVFVVQFFGRPLVWATPAASAPSDLAKPIEPTPKIAAEPISSVLSNDLFISVENGEASEKRGEVLPVAKSEAVSQRQNLGAVFFEALSSPRTLLFYSHLFLSFLISISLAFVIFIEAARKHTRHIVYGAFLLILSISAFYFAGFFIPAGAVVII